MEKQVAEGKSERDADAKKRKRDEKNASGDEDGQLSDPQQKIEEKSRGKRRRTSKSDKESKRKDKKEKKDHKRKRKSHSSRKQKKSDEDGKEEVDSNEMEVDERSGSKGNNHSKSVKEASHEMKSSEGGKRERNSDSESEHSEKEKKRDRRKDEDRSERHKAYERKRSDRDRRERRRDEDREERRERKDDREDRHRHGVDERERRRDRKQLDYGSDRASSRRRRDDDSRDEQRKERRKTDHEHESHHKAKDEGTPKRKREPLSLEDLAKQKQAADENDQKPVFMTKKMREEAAVARRKAQVEAQRNAREVAVEERGGWLKQAPPPSISHRTRDRDRRREDHKDKSSATEKEKEKLMKALQKEYMGIHEKKVFVPVVHEREKRIIDWDLGDDTSVDINPLYNKRADVTLLFGKGTYGGIDQKEQLDKGAKYEALIRDRSKKLATVPSTRKDKMDYRDAHWSEKPLSAMKERDWRIFKEDFSIVVRGRGYPYPMRFWKESHLPQIILDTVIEVGYKEPTAIQRQCIPLGLENRDVIGVAETGSGKTAAFVLPMLVFISQLPKMTAERAPDGPYALVLAPTRELAQQICEETEKFCKPMGYRAYPLVGGVDINQQTFDLRDGCEIMVATPGRMADCLNERFLVLNQCTYVVLDEADRMIDLGFEPQVQYILDRMPVSNMKPDDQVEDDGIDIFNDDPKAWRNQKEPAKHKVKNPFATFSGEGGEDMEVANVVAAETVQDKLYRNTIMFSATMPMAVEKLARKYLRNPVMTVVGSRAGAACKDIIQNVEFVKENEKMGRLTSVLRRTKPPVLVFINAKKTGDTLCRTLEKDGFKVTAIHGGKSQELREVALEAFKDGTYDILVATDVMQRGIDIKGVNLVINYELPKKIEDYTHRIGRTGRAKTKGTALSYLTNDDEDIMYDLKQMLLENAQSVPHELAKHEAAQHKPGTADVRKRKPQVQYARR